MYRQTETALSPNDIQTIASTANYSLTPTSSSKSLVSSDKPTNELMQNNIVNSVSNSSKVYIRNSSNNIYNAPVVINNIYQQSDNAEQLSTKQSTVPENSFSKRFCSIYRGKVRQLCLAKYYITIPVLLLLIIVLIIGLTIWLLDSNNSQIDSGSPSNDTSDPSDLRIVSRTEWSAKPSKVKNDLLTIRPPPMVIIHHTVTGMCYFLEQCTMIVQRIQTDHMNNHGWNDIAYNFLVGGDGFVYEGRGWNVAASHTAGFNYWSIGISLIGTFTREEPTVVQLRATQQLIEYGVRNGYIRIDYKLLGHRQCRNSTNPGDTLYSIIKNWDHWSPKCNNYY